ncbi:MAG: hypothetical protein LUD68_10570 [Rikenellaceae bacterium]|nr:hypothetical protein [Rikenellaceae bacterium]
MATVRLRWSSSSDKRLVTDTYRTDKWIRKKDITHIKADFLIDNIDLAFQVWEETPWGKELSFDLFAN